jgi:2-methylcitrate dehydratase PrpD
MPRASRRRASGPERPLEGLRGFFNVFGGNKDVGCLTGRLGAEWELSGLAYKPYPSGVVLHALIDGCLEIHGRKRSFEKISVGLHPLAIERTDRPEPRNAIEARLSAQHAVAVALLRGRAGLAEFSDAAVTDPEIVAFRKRVTVVRDDSIDKMAAVISEGGASVRVDAARALDDARLEAKFREQAGAQAEPWLRFVQSLEEQERVVLPG